jgi:hypothetical protein
MAQQKLYTEEQARKAIDLVNCFIFFLSDEKKKDKILETLISIELPSDDEINERSYYDKENDNLIVDAAQIARFRDGAKWMREQILNQAK